MPNKLQTKKPRAAKLLGNTSYRLQNRRFMSTELWNTRVQKSNTFCWLQWKSCVFFLCLSCACLKTRLSLQPTEIIRSWKFKNNAKIVSMMLCKRHQIEIYALIEWADISEPNPSSAQNHFQDILVYRI